MRGVARQGLSAFSCSSHSYKDWIEAENKKEKYGNNFDLRVCRLSCRGCLQSLIINHLKIVWRSPEGPEAAVVFRTFIFSGNEKTGTNFSRGA